MGKTSVKLRRRRLKDGRESLYLDIYKDGKRRYEYLGMYLVKPRTPIDRQANKEVEAVAEDIRVKRLLEWQRGEYGMGSALRGSIPVIEYFARMVEEKKAAGGGWESWESCLKQLRGYCGEGTALKDITAEWGEGFKAYMEGAGKRGGGRFSNNTRWLYLEKLRACLNKAVREGIIQKNPLATVRVRRAETERVYLNLEELQRLFKTDCSRPLLKDAFLFSCLTGLRVSDIEKLTWGEVQEFGGGERIVFRQKKTGGQEYLDISKQAYALMGKRGEDGEKVFGSFHYHSNLGEVLGRWARKAGINKHITFHSGRHTFAVLMLSLGVDIYTVSKLLGHRDLSTTQIYAKVIDEKKREAVGMIPDLG